MSKFIRVELGLDPDVVERFVTGISGKLSRVEMVAARFRVSYRDAERILKELRA